MTELEWCRANAPSVYEGVSDEELVMYMHSAYLKFCEDVDTTNSVEQESSSKREINNHIDYMATELCQALGGNAAFKGGYVLTKLMPTLARQTTDVDLSIMQESLYEDVKELLLNVTQRFMQDGVIDDYKIKDTVQPTMSGGVDYYKDGHKILGVDVGLHDISYGVLEMDFDVGHFKTFEVERMLADKTTAILSRKRFRRPKDLYDLYCITQVMSFDAKKIAEYILRRTDGAGADWQNYPFDDVVCREYKKAYESLRLQSIYKGVDLTRPDFEVALGRFYTVAKKVQVPLGQTKWNVTGHYFE